MSFANKEAYLFLWFIRRSKSYNSITSAKQTILHYEVLQNYITVVKISEQKQCITKGTLSLYLFTYFTHTQNRVIYNRSPSC